MLDQVETKLDDVESGNNFSISVNKAGFATALSHVQSVVERRNIVPILSNVLLETHSDRIKITATDMDIVISETVSASIKKAGSVTVDAHMLYDIVRKLEDESDIEIDFSPEKGKINILSKNCSFSLSVLSPKDFPKLDDENYDHSFSIDSSEFKLLIDQCKFAVSSEETRYNLNGVFMHYEGKNLRLVATDGHRLCCADSASELIMNEFEGVIIPKKSVMEIRKVIDSIDGNINISISANKIRVSNDVFVFVSKLIGAKFPDYQNLMPEDNNISIEISSKDFSKAVDRVSTITNEKFKGIKFSLAGDKFSISSKNDDGSFAIETLHVITNAEKEFEVGFNARYVSDVMSVIKGDKVTFNFKDNFSPAVLSDISNKKFQYIIMPMRV
ncbi:MAG: DNA polymerase III subunit beta [Alphaproteobacteria bacterium]|nr:DNA polymerase III subunit beta [Alphaproteobacteria bacterium]